MTDDLQNGQAPEPQTDEQNAPVASPAPQEPTEEKSDDAQAPA